MASPITGVSDNAAPVNNESATSAVSWPAIIAGAVVTAALSFVLLSLGAGLGFAAMPAPGNMHPGGAAALTLAAAVWMIITQWFSAGLGGYLTGRLRTKWVGVHTHEIFFRDTVHGFLSWALSAVAVLLLAGGATGFLSHHPHEMPGQGPDHADGPMAYYLENLYRPTGGHPTPLDPDTRAESEHILAMGAAQGKIDEPDRAYLTQLVSDHSGVSLVDAEHRVDQTVSNIQASETKVQDALASLAIYTALSMLIGAFIAAVAAALGGYERDKNHSTLPVI